MGVWEGCLYLRPALEGAQALPSTAYPQTCLLVPSICFHGKEYFLPPEKAPSLAWVGFYFTLLQVGEVPSVSSLGVSGQESIRTSAVAYTRRRLAAELETTLGLSRTKKQVGTDSGSLVRGGECSHESLPSTRRSLGRRQAGGGGVGTALRARRLPRRHPGHPGPRAFPTQDRER